LDWQSNLLELLNLAVRCSYRAVDDTLYPINRRKEVFYPYQVDNQAIVIPETVDAVRALAGREPSAQASIERTNRTLGVRQRFV
jgi:hypothetical protein